MTETNAKATEISLRRHVTRAEEKQYLLLPFDMPGDVERLTLTYAYDSRLAVDYPVEAGSFTSRQSVNTIDLGLLAPDGTQVGVSGSNKREITISETDATPGYRPTALTQGTWHILIGAYHVGEQGVDVDYRLRFEFKHPRWLRGDMHTHTIASDGILPLKHLAKHARLHGLDFLAITDHNQPVLRASMPRVDGMTLIPGMEWTHYKGHSNFLGLEAPYVGSFVANTEEEAARLFNEAHDNGALIVLNHPFESDFGFRFDFDALPWDLIEVWNGPMRPSNLQTIGWWDQQLKAGRKIAATCGSDYHEDTLFQRLANPTINVWSQSASETDILAAVKAGRSYFTSSPIALRVVLRVGEASYGDTVAWVDGMKLHFSAAGLNRGDVARLITQNGTQEVFTAPADGAFECEMPVSGPGYARVEVWREYFPGLPTMQALVSNPVWFA